MRKAFAKVVEWLHAKRHFNAGMLSEKEPRALVEETFNVLQTPLKDLSISQEIPPELTAALEENVFIFSGFKTYHELKEASMLLKDENGGFKPFDRFRQDVEAIDSTYNRNYLAAEYEFAVASSQMAVKWKELEKDGDRYDLQYRTAGDDRVRPEHAALNGITLPPSDKFWDEYYPPNGWRCRCTAVQVRKGKYPESDPAEAAKAGERATTQIGKDGTNKGKIFRFNPGKQEKIFPPKHPYFPKGCGNCKYKNLAFDKDRQECQVCASLIKSLQNHITKKDKIETARIIKEKKKELEKYNGILLYGKRYDSGKLRILRNTLDNIYEHSIEDETIRQWLRNFDVNEFKKLKYKGWAENRTYKEGDAKFDPSNPDKRKHGDTYYFLYYTLKINNRDYWVNVKMHKEYGELVYTIEKEKPKDIIYEHKKK